jgi:hypothetical protein
MVNKKAEVLLGLKSTILSNKNPKSETSVT